MYRRTTVGAIATALLALAYAQASMAQGNCGDIEFDDAITSRFPNARNACLGVVERDGEQYAHFQARIVRVRGGEVQAEFKQPDGSYGQTVSFTPSPDARIRIQGRTYRYGDLARGQELDVYLPPDRWALAVHEDPTADFETAARITTVELAEPEPALAATLPSTAGQRPWLAVLGFTLLAFGAAVAGIGRVRTVKNRR